MSQQACCSCSHHAHMAENENDRLAKDQESVKKNLKKENSTCIVYHIANMDCPMEENLIRKKLSGMRGIVSMDFNLMQRTLTICHTLPATAPIKKALVDIDMTPEVMEKNRETAVFSVPGMDCPVEENLIRKKLANVSGIQELDFDLMKRKLSLTFTPGALPAISAALASLDMGAVLATESEEVVTEAPIPWKKLFWSLVLAGVSEAVELAGEWHPVIGGFDLSASLAGSFSISQAISLICAIAAILLSGLGTYKKGWIAISNFNLNINALMSVAVTGAVLIGQFPEAAMVMALFTLSEALEARALNKARNAIRDLLALTPEKATVQNADGSWVEKEVREIPLKSRIRVRPGEKVALDGIIVSGNSTINQAPITGESMPVEKRAGDPVYAGTLNESGSFEFEVTATTTQSTLARIIESVEAAQATRAPAQRFVDIFARYYTPVIFLLALATATVSPLAGLYSWHEGIYTGLVILVIGCPCALVIATPVSIVSGLAAAMRRGLLVRGGIFLEQGRKLQCIAFDKTGTITNGQPELTSILPLSGLEENKALALAGSLSDRSDHPVSQAIARGGRAKDIQFQTVDCFEALPGMGTSGVIAGSRFWLGNFRLMQRHCSEPEKLEQKILDLEKQGRTVVGLMNDKTVLALFAVADTIRDTSRQALTELRDLGITTVMLTGDNATTAGIIAREAGVADFQANLLPEGKLEYIGRMEAKGTKIGMVGDGINDAPALAKADIGFAMAQNGADTAIETADVALMTNDLRKIPAFIRLSRATFAIITENIAFALLVKAVFFALALTGNATMWEAVFADVGTSLIVVANGLRAGRK